jgi:hypothetical protein
MRFFYPAALACALLLLTACAEDPVTPATDVTQGDSAVAPTGTVVINEIAANGAGEDWVEFYNSGESDVDLGGWLFTDSDPEHSYVFPDNTLLSVGAFLVVARSSTAGFDFGLGDADAVILYNSEGEKVHELAWGETDAPGGTSYGYLPDGEGSPGTLYEPTPGAPNASLSPSCGNALIEFGEVCDGSNFSGETCGGLGYKSGELTCEQDCTLINRSACTLYDTVIVVNEISSTDNDPIELLNTSDEEVSLTGWVVADKRGRTDDDAYAFPPGTVIGAGAYLVLEKGKDFKFGLGGDDAVMLYSPQGLVDVADWAADEAVVSYCRVPDGSGDFAACASASFGSTNTP